MAGTGQREVASRRRRGRCPLTAFGAVGLGAGAYLAGSISLLLVLASLVWGVTRLRRRLLPTWDGGPARLAEVVMGVGTVVLTAQVLGVFGWMHAIPMLVACVAAGVLQGVVAGRLPVYAASADEDAPVLDAEEGDADAGSPRLEIVAAVLAGGLVAAQWATHIGDAFSRGMTHGDTLWYQATFAARWVQTGRLLELDTTGLEDLATPLHGMLPLTGTLVHAIVMLPFDNDLLSPLVNVGWAVITMLAAWCIGRRAGVGALAVLGAIVLLGTPTIAGAQPGQAVNDIATAGMFLAAVALLLEGRMAPVPTALAGVAAGLALGIKLTVLVPVAVLTIGLVVVALRARRPWAIAAWLGGMVPFGAYWLVRNWFVFDTPLPWSDLSLGPITFSAAIPTRPGLIAVLDESFTWSEYIVPGFSKSLGRGWFVILVLATVGAVLGIVRRRRPLDLWLGLSVFAGAIGVALIPFGSDLGGGAFVFMVRYLTAELLVGFLLLFLTLAHAPVVWRRIVLAVLVLLAVVSATAPHIESVRGWPSDQIALGVFTGLAVVAVTGAVLVRPAAARVANRGAMIAVVILVLIGGGWVLQRYYLDHRYVDAGLPYDRANDYFNEREGQRIAVLGTHHYYPFFGNDLSNHVARVRGPAEGPEGERCRIWRERLSAGDYDYIVLAHDPFVVIPSESFIASDRAASVVLRDGSSTVFRIEGPFEPDACP